MAEVKQLHCKRCHRFVTFYAQDKDGTQLLRHGEPYGAKVRSNAWVINGKELAGYFVRCRQCKTINVIKDTPEMIAEAERLKYNFGRLCDYHYRYGAVCDQRQPCEGDETHKPCRPWVDFWKAVKRN